MAYDLELQSNNIELQEILDSINNLPEAGSGGVELPELTNEGEAANLLAGEQFIDSTGNIVTGTMVNNGKITSTMDGIETKTVSIPVGYTSGGTVSLTDDIDNEVDTQANLLAQLSTILDGKAAGGSSGGGNAVIEELTVTENGTYEAPSGVNGYNPVTVNVPILEGYIQPSGELKVTENGTYDVTTYASVNVDVATGDNNDVAGSIVDRTITAYSNKELKTVGFRGFSHCQQLVSVDLPEVTTISTHGFNSCYKLERVEFPKLTTMIAGDNFTYSSALKYADLGLVSNLPSWSLANCTKLETVILRKTESICTLQTTNALTSTPIANGTGYIYVPRTLVDSYKAATNWSTYASQIRAIEDYPDICGGTE